MSIICSLCETPLNRGDSYSANQSSQVVCGRTFKKDRSWWSFGVINITNLSSKGSLLTEVLAVLSKCSHAFTGQHVKKQQKLQKELHTLISMRKGMQVLEEWLWHYFCGLSFYYSLPVLLSFCMATLQTSLQCGIFFSVIVYFNVCLQKKKKMWMDVHIYKHVYTYKYVCVFAYNNAYASLCKNRTKWA